MLFAICKHHDWLLTLYMRHMTNPYLWITRRKKLRKRNVNKMKQQVANNEMTTMNNTHHFREGVEEWFEYMKHHIDIVVSTRIHMVEWKGSLMGYHHRLLYIWVNVFRWSYHIISLEDAATKEKVTSPWVHSWIWRPRILISLKENRLLNRLREIQTNVRMCRICRWIQSYSI